MIPEPPLGRLVTMTVPPGCWDGPAPAPGNWLGTARGRTSYEIAGVRTRASGAMVITARRWPRGKEPEAARIAQWFLWTWARRDCAH